MLTEPSQSRLLNLFETVQRPVLTSYRDDKGKREAQSALAPVVRTLGKRLPRMPFPTYTKDWHFDFEKILDSNVRRYTSSFCCTEWHVRSLMRSQRVLESLLTPAIHSIELLKAQIEVEERALDMDREQLGELERNAAFAEKERTRQTKKVSYNRGHDMIKSSIVIFHRRMRFSYYKIHPS